LNTASWTYATTDLVTGELLMDTVPIVVPSMTLRMDGTGELSATLPGVLLSRYASVLQPGKTVLWALYRNTPVWAGIIWAWQATSARGDLPMVVKTLPSLLAKRKLTGVWVGDYDPTPPSDLVYTNADPFDILRDIITRVTTDKGPHGEIGNLSVDPETLAGTSVTRTYKFSDLPVASEAMANLRDTCNLEYAFRPELISGVLTHRLYFGYPWLTLVPDLVSFFPGVVTDYSTPEDYESRVNDVVAVGDLPDGTGQMAARAVGYGDYSLGLPVLEGSSSFVGSGITDLATLTAHAVTEVTSAGRRVATTVELLTSPSSPPTMLAPGMNAYIKVLPGTSVLHPMGATLSGRVTELTITPSSVRQVGSATLVLGLPTVSNGDSIDGLVG